MLIGEINLLRSLYVRFLVQILESMTAILATVAEMAYFFICDNIYPNALKDLGREKNAFE